MREWKTWSYYGNISTFFEEDEEILDICLQAVFELSVCVISLANIILFLNYLSSLILRKYNLNARPV